jgi:alkylated DNA nucleotide flippase Atl1
LRFIIKDYLCLNTFGSFAAKKKKKKKKKRDSMLTSLLQRHTAFSFHVLKSVHRYFLGYRCLSYQRSDKWLAWEDDLLQNYVKHNGKKWTEFVQHCLPTRSPSQCQSRWSNVLDPQFKHGPFSTTEKKTLEEAIEAMGGPGQWTEISKIYLPHRSPRRIANEWSSSATRGRKKWTPEEDALLLQGIYTLGPSSWSKIAATYLPWRSRSQIRNHYRACLLPDTKKNDWSSDELDLLLRRTIVFGQDWHKVAEGIRGRLPEQCRVLWMNVMDPALNKGDWSKEESKLFWERMVSCGGSFTRVAEGLPGRNRIMCFHKFRETVYKDQEFRVLHEDDIKCKEEENAPQWRSRVAKLVCHWLDQEKTIKESANRSIHINQQGTWSQQELSTLDDLVNQYLKEKTSLTNADWKQIASHFKEKDARQCKYQYQEHLFVKDIKKGSWTKEEDVLLKQAIQQHGTSNWDKIVQMIPHRNRRQCAYRWHRVLQFEGQGEQDQTIIRYKRLSEQEKDLIREGVQMFGPNWTAIRMTYLPKRTPEQLMRWWNSQRETEQDRWTEDEDKALVFAVNKYADDNGHIPSWATVAKMVQSRSSKQCRTRWMYALKPNLKKGVWSYDEEMQLLEIVQKYKSETSKATSIWPLVAKALDNGRSDKACRSKYDYMQRKGHRFAY